MGVEGIGASVVRKEDRRFITGKGRYVDDIKLQGMTYAHFVRSPHAQLSVHDSRRLAKSAPRVTTPSETFCIHGPQSESEAHRYHYDTQGMCNQKRHISFWPEASISCNQKLMCPMREASWRERLPFTDRLWIDHDGCL